MIVSFFVNALVAILAVDGSNAVSPAESQDAIVTLSQIPTGAGIGSCLANNRAFDLSNMLLISNERAVVGEGSSHPITVSVSRETVQLSEENQDQVMMFDVGAMIEETEDVDIIVSLAILKGQLVIFWKESYVNRIYRQGLFAINGVDDISFLCEGFGGVDRVH